MLCRHRDTTPNGRTGEKHDDRPQLSFLFPSPYSLRPSLALITFRYLSCTSFPYP